MKNRSPAILLLLLPALVHAEISLHPLFGDGAVLQRGQPLPIWGKADPGAKVEVSFGGQTRSAAADGDGRWRVVLDPLEASADPRELTARAGTSATSAHVVVGDVWLASGQSNMASPMSSGSAALALPSATDSLIRSFNVTKNVAAEPPFAPGGKWEPSTPESARNFSAVAYFFAQSIRTSQNVPVGIINSSWGGTPIRTWMSAASIEAPPPAEKILKEWQDALAKHKSADEEALKTYYQDRKDWETQVDQPFRAARKAWEAEAATARAAGQPVPPQPKQERPKPESPDPLAMPAPGTSDRPSAPTACFNAMIAPLSPFGLRGVLWYQGEADASRGLEYRDLLQRLIKGWRTAWNQDQLPFLIVQLPGHGKNDETVASKGIAWLREAQDLAQQLPNVHIAVTSDIGDAVDVHPDNKAQTGERLALVARQAVHGEKIAGLSPRFRAMRVEGNQAVLEFDHTGGGLVIGQAPWVAKGAAQFPGDQLIGFFVAGEDKQWAAAEARIDGETVIVSAPSVAVPVAVRYAWANTPQANLYNRDGLPAAPFRTDDWAR